MALLHLDQSGRRRLLVASTSCLALALLAAGAHFAAADDEPPSSAPVAFEDNDAQQIRRPPGPDGKQPADPAGDKAAAHKAKSDARYGLTVAQQESARSILARDTAFRDLVGTAAYRVVGQGSWKAADSAEPIGSILDIQFTKPFSKKDAELPTLRKDSEGNLVRDTYRADLVNIELMTVTVRYADDAVVEVTADADGETSDVVYPSTVPSTDVGEPKVGSTPTSAPAAREGS